MNDILSEKQYQHEIMDYLQSVNGYTVRKNTCFDRYYAWTVRCFLSSSMHRSRIS